MSRVLPLPRKRPLASLADVLEPIEDDDLPTRVAGDMAFADTVLGLPDETPPASTPFVVKDPAPSFPAPLASVSEPEGPRRNVGGALSELGEAWREASRTAAGRFQPPTTALGVVLPPWIHTPVARVSFTLARLRAMLSVWEWGTSDLVRAVVIGGAVFVVAAAIGAGVLARSPAAPAEAPAELREAHTVQPVHVERTARLRVKATTR